MQNVSLMVFLGLASVCRGQDWGWETVETQGQPTARHEATLISFDNNIDLIGGRRINRVDVFDPVTNVWTAKTETPMDLHHLASPTARGVTGPV